VLPAKVLSQATRVVKFVREVFNPRIVSFQRERFPHAKHRLGRSSSLATNTDTATTWRRRSLGTRCLANVPLKWAAKATENSGDFAVTLFLVRRWREAEQTAAGYSILICRPNGVDPSGASERFRHIRANIAQPKSHKI
jgi:hypothetical protein